MAEALMFWLGWFGKLWHIDGRRLVD